MTGTPVLEVQDLHVWFDLGQGRELHPVQGAGIKLGVQTRLDPLDLFRCRRLIRGGPRWRHQGGLIEGCAEGS